ncbi:outer membrane lipoprotein carrier protein LolA [Sediminibacillus sp. JSM 1682029]|uniref:LolA family protein n=1 Tax=Sediminibacillus sp. JSM 1682029 TaxID=3229857 RepID=UPI0035266DEA
MKHKGWLSIVLLLVVMTGCKGDVGVSSEEIFTKVLAESEEPLGYYGEGSVSIKDGETEEKTTFEEYAGRNGQRKVITEEPATSKRSIALMDGGSMTIYEEGSKTAQRMDLSPGELPASLTQKEQLLSMLDVVQGTHDTELVGEDTILDMETYHLKLTSKEDGLLGDMDIWVEQENWFIVKMKQKAADIETNVEYTKLDLDPDFSDDTFLLELPEDVKVSDLEEGMAVPASLEEAEQALGTDFLLVDDEKQELDRIEMDKIGGEINRTEVTFYYLQDGVPSFSISVFPTPEGEGMSLGDGNLKVRGNDAEKMDEIRGITWDEQGLRYSLLMEHPDLTTEEVLQLTETMKMHSEL